MAHDKPRVRVKAGRALVAPSAPIAPSPGVSAAYMRGGELPLFFRWQPALRDSNDDVRAAWRLAASRAVDAIQNSGWLAGAVDQSTASVVGSGLRLNAKPDAESLGMSDGEANRWAERVEARFAMWASSPRSCDAGARFTFGQLQGQAYRHYLATGEVLGSLPWITRPGGGWGTKLRLLPAWRLSTETRPPHLVNGVELDDDGAPRAYRIKVRDANGSERDETFAAVDAYGRPLILHIFEGEPGQVRGISPLAPVLKVVRQFDQLADATLSAALIQAIFAAMFQSPAPNEEVIAGLQSEDEQQDASALESMVTGKKAWYRNTDLDVGVTGKIIHGYPGDELKFFRSEHPNSTYADFAKFLLREISRVLAITYEDFSGDYAGATFSSARMGTASVWPRVVRRRAGVCVPLCQAIYEAWLEEEIERGSTEFPGGLAGFLDNRAAAARALWRGPTKPQADELKAANAAKVWRDNGMSDAVVYEELGLDVDAVYEQRRRERDRRRELDLEDARPATTTAGDDDAADQQDDD